MLYFALSLSRSQTNILPISREAPLACYNRSRSQCKKRPRVKRLALNLRKVTIEVALFLYPFIIILIYLEYMKT